MNTIKWLGYCLCAVSLMAGRAAPAAATNTARILSDTAAALPSCVQWALDGTCLWLLCIPGVGCTVNTTLRVRNYVPDAVVTVRNDVFINPWKEMSAVTASTSGALSLALQAATGHAPDANGNAGKTDTGRRRQQFFRDVDVFGHPLGLSQFLGAANISAPICPPRTIGMFPYYQSSLDAAVWRGIVPIESIQPEALTPGLREIGDFPLNTWGSVYPRIGTVVQQEEPKAAAILAQRAADIVTRPRDSLLQKSHVYIPLSKWRRSMGYRWFNPEPIKERDADTGVWQMLEPKTDTSCYVFGDNDALSLRSWSADRLDDQGDYVFNLWRPYSCCKHGIGVYIGSIPGVIGSAAGIAVTATGGVGVGSLGGTLGQVATTVSQVGQIVNTVNTYAGYAGTAVAVVNMLTATGPNANTRTVTIEWELPKERVDGEQIDIYTELSSVTIYGSPDKDRSNFRPVAEVSYTIGHPESYVTKAEIDVPANVVEFAATVHDIWGNESQYSNIKP